MRAAVQRVLTAVCLGLNREGIWVAYNVELHALLRPVALGLKTLGVFLRNEDCGKVIRYDLLAVIVSWFCDYCLIELGEMSSWVEAKTGWLYISTSRIPTSEVSTLLRNLNIKLGG
jgi:hypothetical protein